MRQQNNSSGTAKPGPGEHDEGIRIRRALKRARFGSVVVITLVGAICGKILAPVFMIFKIEWYLLPIVIGLALGLVSLGWRERTLKVLDDVAVLYLRMGSWGLSVTLRLGGRRFKHPVAVFILVALASALAYFPAQKIVDTHRAIEQTKVRSKNFEDFVVDFVCGESLSTQTEPKAANLSKVKKSLGHRSSGSTAYHRVAEVIEGIYANSTPDQFAKMPSICKEKADKISVAEAKSDSTGLLRLFKARLLLRSSHNGSEIDAVLEAHELLDAGRPEEPAWFVGAQPKIRTTVLNYRGVTCKLLAQHSRQLPSGHESRGKPEGLLNLASRHYEGAHELASMSDLETTEKRIEANQSDLELFVFSVAISEERRTQIDLDLLTSDSLRTLARRWSTKPDKAIEWALEKVDELHQSMRTLAHPAIQITIAQYLCLVAECASNCTEDDRKGIDAHEFARRAVIMIENAIEHFDEREILHHPEEFHFTILEEWDDTKRHYNRIKERVASQ